MIQFIVYGKPQSRGSKIPIRTKTGRMFAKDSNPRSEPWMNAIRAEASKHMKGRELITGAVRVDTVFHFARPKNHFGTGKNSGKLKGSAPQHHIQMPDRLKCSRGLEDALTGVVIRDDAQIVDGVVRKRWTIESERTEVTITELE